MSKSIIGDVIWADGRAWQKILVEKYPKMPAWVTPSLEIPQEWIHNNLKNLKKFSDFRFLVKLGKPVGANMTVNQKYVQETSQTGWKHCGCGSLSSDSLITFYDKGWHTDYSHNDNIVYIHVTDGNIIHSNKINNNLAVDLAEDETLIGFEIALNKKSLWSVETNLEMIVDSVIEPERIETLLVNPKFKEGIDSYIKHYCQAKTLSL